MPVARLDVDGELDAATAPGLVLAGRQALSGRRRTTLAIDMHGVTFIGAAGINALVAIGGHAAPDDNVVVVAEPSRCVVRLLELTVLADTFGVGLSSGRRA